MGLCLSLWIKWSFTKPEGSENFLFLNLILEQVYDSVKSVAFLAIFLPPEFSADSQQLTIILQSSHFPVEVV